MDVYSYNDVYKASLSYFAGDELAADVFVRKYALKDGDGNILELTPDDMHRRLAAEFARIERKYPNPMSEEEIFGLLRGFRYIVPQGSPMTGIGNNTQVVSLSNCFVVDSPNDSYGGIMRADQEQVQLMKRRGGVGMDLSKIRPNGSIVRNAALTSTGVVSYMKRYSNTTREVAQDGRRGALMLSISIEHPDSGDFIDAKLDTKEVTGANISVRITDEFMAAVNADAMYTQRWPVGSSDPKVTKEVKARDLWDKLMNNAWKSAEPGVLNWGRIITESIPDCYADQGYGTSSTNPCGEIPLSPYDSCRLIAINLYSYVVNPFTQDAYFDFELFKSHVKKAQRLIDDLIDLELEKISSILNKLEIDPELDEDKSVELNLWKKIYEQTSRGRRTGLGITAEGDMLAAMGYVYGTPEATDFSVDVHRHIAAYAYMSTIDMAGERGAFDVYNMHKEMKNPFLERVMSAVTGFEPVYGDLLKRNGRRNMALLTIAPTGTTSIMTQTTSGMEPAFMVAYKRRRKINSAEKDHRVDFVDESGDAWQEYNVFHPKFKTWLSVSGHDVEKVALMGPDELQEVIDQSPYANATANDVDWVEKVKMQGDVQKWVDHSISVTINLPSDTTVETVDLLYRTAFHVGCKGLTIYRDGSRDGVLVSNNKSDGQLLKSIKENQAPKRPKRLECEVLRFFNKNEKWIGFMGKFNDRPFEIFTGRASEFPIPGSITEGEILKVKDNGHGSRYDFVYTDKNGERQVAEGLNRVFHKEYWNYAKLTSSLIQYGMPPAAVNEIIGSLNLDGMDIHTWQSGVSRMFKKYIDNGTKSKTKCESCGESALVYEEGCLTCKNCGNAKCG